MMCQVHRVDILVDIGVDKEKSGEWANWKL